MRLSPLQSRLAASAAASCLLIILYIFLFAPQFASAAELAEISIDHDTDNFFNVIEDAPDRLGQIEPSYQSDFPLFDRGIMGRVPDGVSAIAVDIPIQSNIEPGSTMVYVFQVASVSGRSAQALDTAHELRRDLSGVQGIAEGEGEDDGDNELNLDGGLKRRNESTRTIYISANTCNQPGRISPDQTTVDPPQLTMFVSTSTENTLPGPGKDGNTQETIIFNEGAVMFNTSLEHDVYFSISAPQVSDKQFSTSSPYNYKVAVSLEGYYYAYDDQSQPDLFWVDSDALSALLTTRNLTSDPTQTISTPPYQIFVQDTANPAINGLRKSYCGLSQWAQIRPLQDGSDQVTVGLRQGGADNLTMEEFYISGLNASTNYTGIVVDTSLPLSKRQAGGDTRGLIVYNGVDFNTKPNGACTFIFNLTVCTETRYAVPGNSTLFPNGTALAAFYDDYTKGIWDSFDKILQQTPCEAPPTQKYSLVRNCDDCKKAYKDWLCSVAIPRCEDFSSPARDGLQMRNINAPFSNGTLVDQSIRDTFGDMLAYNSSRNPNIDSAIQPGPYKEVLPCDYLCYELVKSCPASMGFACPLPHSKFGFRESYAVPDKSQELSCNYPGSAYYPSAASAMMASWVGVATATLIATLLLLV